MTTITDEEFKETMRELDKRCKSLEGALHTWDIFMREAAKLYATWNDTHYEDDFRKCQYAVAMVNAIYDAHLGPHLRKRKK